MPYIKQERRKDFDPILKELCHELLNREVVKLEDVKGQVNYCFTKILVTLLERYKVGYKNLSAIHSIAVDVANEFRREYLEPYEDIKIKENGIVKPLKV